MEERIFDRTPSRSPDMVSSLGKRLKAKEGNRVTARRRQPSRACEPVFRWAFAYPGGSHFPLGLPPSGWIVDFHSGEALTT